MKVNGAPCPLAAPTPLPAFLIAQGYDPSRVAIELNGAILPRARWDGTLLCERDTLEIVSFVGGG